MTDIRGTCAMVTLGAALALGGVLVGSGRGDALLSVDSATTKQEGCTPATDHQVATLIESVLPSAKVVSASSLSFDSTVSTCLTEVVLLAERSDPATKGTIYVLPGGKAFLNGPLMKENSQVGLAPEGDNTDQDQKVEISQRELEALVQLATGHVVAQGAQPVTDTSSAQQRARIAHVEQLKSLPAIVFNEGGASVAYVMYDPQCSRCQALFSQQAELIAKHDIEFRWYPVHLNGDDKSWTMNALVLGQQSPQAAKVMLEEMLSGSWTPETHVEALRTIPTEAYIQASDITEYFRQLTQTNPDAGTPFVAYRRSYGEIDLFNGQPDLIDWQ